MSNTCHRSLAYTCRDVRNTLQPKSRLEGIHTGHGVLSIDWSAQDSSLLLKAPSLQGTAEGAEVPVALEHSECFCNLLDAPAA